MLAREGLESTVESDLLLLLKQRQLELEELNNHADVSFDYVLVDGGREREERVQSCLLKCRSGVLDRICI